MRILVLSDLHSNATALNAVLDAARDRWDLSVCLGDVVGYGPDPNEVTALLRELGTQTIRGNHDKAVTGLMPTEDFNPVEILRGRSEEHTSDSSHVKISYAVFCLKKKKK